MGKQHEVAQGFFPDDLDQSPEFDPTDPLPPAPESDQHPARRTSRSWTGPHYEVLIDPAIEKERPDDVLDWYDELREARAGLDGGCGFVRVDWEERIAEAVTSSYPDRPIDMIVEAADAVASETNTRTYSGGGPAPEKGEAGPGEEWPQRGVEFPRRRYDGDVPDPRGGIRWLIPERARYWEDERPTGLG